MEMLTSWFYIVIAAVVCIAIWAIFTNGDNDWGRIPFFLRLPLLVVSVCIASLFFILFFAVVRLIPDLIEVVINVVLIIIGFIVGWETESIGAVVEPIWGIIGDILVTPYVLGCVLVVGFFPNFPNDRFRNMIYKVLATLEVSTIMIYAFFDTKGQLSTLDCVIFTIEVVGCAIFVIWGVFSEYNEESNYRKRRFR